MPSAQTPKEVGRSLPIWQQQAAIVAAIAKHRVVIIDGPPGCGKTTQLPQMLREAGLVRGIIGITQPRRIAAISVAERLAAELEVQLGSTVGYAIRFDDNTSEQTRIKVMTDGILLQETRHNPTLAGYDLIMVDEAHERSLNIDFTMGLLLRALHKRPDLKVVISSATLPPSQLQQFFAACEPNVPVVAVSHRTYPVAIEYAGRPAGYALDDIAESVLSAVEHIFARQRRGHVLVFLPGEAAIVRCQLWLAREGPAGAQVLPLYGRLPQVEQARVFAEHRGARKIVLATNLAETSITIDGITAVVDSGKQKVPYFQARTGVTMLQEEWVSQASADQRAGRAGRTGPGLVLRLYEPGDAAELVAQTQEEILRIDLSEAVLRLIDLGIRDVDRFPLPTPPPRGKLRAAFAHLTTLGAIDGDRKLTQVGKAMVPFPLSPALARMVVAAVLDYPAALADVLLVGAMLSIRSPFNTPSGREEEARARHKQFRHPLGDALSMLALFLRYRAAKDPAQFCQQYFIDPDPMAFAMRAHAQLTDIAEQAGAPVVDGRGQPQDVLRCVLAGFADKVIKRDAYGAETSLGVRCAAHPSSALYRSKHAFLVANELVQSGAKTYAFGLSALEPAWIRAACPEAARRWGLMGEQTSRRAPPHGPRAKQQGQPAGPSELGPPGSPRNRPAAANGQSGDPPRGSRKRRHRGKRNKRP